jgi:surface polysaccharide O-acyltransferase-like enzyme
MNRVVYLDWLRSFAILAVVTIHVSAGYVSTNLFETPSSFWVAANLYETITRCAVPIFVMISGALILSSKKQLTYKEFLLKRTSKVFIPLLGWSIIYYAFYTLAGRFEVSISQFIKLFLTNGISVHFWYIYMILGLYLITPLVKIFIKNASKKDIEYFLILWLFASVVTKLMTFIFGFSINLELYYTTNYVGYFILGYYLFHFNIQTKIVRLSYVGAIIGLLLTFFLTYFYTNANGGQLEQFWYEYHSPNVVLISIGCFLLAKTYFTKNNTLPKSISLISETSFGVYLIHMIILNIIARKLITLFPDNFHPLFEIPIVVALTSAISIILVLINKRIPILNKLTP